MVKEQGNTTGGKTNSRAPVYGDSHVSRMSVVSRSQTLSPQGAYRLEIISALRRKGLATRD